MLGTLGTSPFTNAKWFQLMIASLIGTQQEGHSLFVFIPALLVAFLRSNDLFGSSLQYSALYNSCANVQQQNH
jgi:hypothetical protein